MTWKSLGTGLYASSVVWFKGKILGTVWTVTYCESFTIAEHKEFQVCSVGFGESTVVFGGSGAEREQ